MIYAYLLIGLGVDVALHCAYHKKVREIPLWRLFISIVISTVLWPLALFAQFYPDAF